MTIKLFKPRRNPASGFSPAFMSGTPENKFNPATHALSGINQSPLIQPKLNVGATNDKYEREADQVADQVLSMCDGPFRKQSPGKTDGPQENSAQNPIPLVTTTQTSSGIEFDGDRNTGAEQDISSVQAGGQPLSESSRRYFEPRFGHDFSQVRVHTDSHAANLAQDLNAKAFTLQQNIAFDSGQYVPDSSHGKRLIAHELAHVVQQNKAPPAIQPSSGALSIHSIVSSQPTIQRQVPVQSSSAQPHQPQQIAPNQENQWVRTVDDAVRNQFGLRGPRMTAGRVNFQSQSNFAASFPNASMEDKLLELFLSPSGNIHSILRAHRILFASPQRMRRFVRDRITAGFFNEHFLDVRRGVTGVRPITPRDLLAQHVAGITNVAPNARGHRRVQMQRNQDVEVLVHEACHFYVSNGFKQLAASVPNRGYLTRGAGIEHTLMEGYAELFARKVMRNNSATLGPMGAGAYQFQVDQVSRYTSTIGWSEAEDAYFRGDQNQLSRLRSALQRYETTHPDLIEPWA